jgi:hypothetical protein
VNALRRDAALDQPIAKPLGFSHAPEPGHQDAAADNELRRQPAAEGGDRRRHARFGFPVETGPKNERNVDGLEREFSPIQEDADAGKEQRSGQDNRDDREQQRLRHHRNELLPAIERVARLYSNGLM